MKTILLVLTICVLVGASAWIRRDDHGAPGPAASRPTGAEPVVWRHAQVPVPRGWTRGRGAPDTAVWNGRAAGATLTVAQAHAADEDLAAILPPTAAALQDEVAGLRVTRLESDGSQAGLIEFELTHGQTRLYGRQLWRRARGRDVITTWSARSADSLGHAAAVAIAPAAATGAGRGPAAG